jgi:hypothetical protein
MRIVSFIDQADVIKKILQHLRLWESHVPSQSEPARKEIKSSPLTHPAANSRSYRNRGADVQPGPQIRAKLT